MAYQIKNLDYPSHFGQRQSPLTNAQVIWARHNRIIRARPLHPSFFRYNGRKENAMGRDLTQKNSQRDKFEHSRASLFRSLLDCAFCVNRPEC